MRHLGRWRWISFLIIVVSLSVLGWITRSNFLSSHGAEILIQWGKKIFYWPLNDLWTTKILTPVFWIAVVFILLLEWFFPAKPAQKILSISFIQDIVWLAYSAVLQAAILVTYVAWLKAIYQNHFSFLTIHGLSELPYWSRFLIGVLTVDFLRWIQHRLNHTVPLFWHFHAVHHSQRELNLFTESRYHICEYLVSQTFITIPLLILAINTPQIIYFALFHEWFVRFSHGNIKTNLGPLRYILVTPQSHRVHHSIEPFHRQTNFGTMFSFWDHLFGTQYRHYDEYPDTGLRDKNFPHEHSHNIASLILVPFQQMMYSFHLVQRFFIATLKKNKVIAYIRQWTGPSKNTTMAPPVIANNRLEKYHAQEIISDSYTDQRSSVVDPT